MKQINLTSVEVKEVILHPEAEYPLAVLYEILDDTGKVFATKRRQVKAEELPAKAKTALQEIITKITDRLNLLEEL